MTHDWVIQNETLPTASQTTVVEENRTSITSLVPNLNGNFKEFNILIWQTTTRLPSKVKTINKTKTKAKYEAGQSGNFQTSQSPIPTEPGPRL